MRGAFPKVLVLWAVWAAATLLVAAGAASLPVSTAKGWGPELSSIAPPLARWDSGWYYGIATLGYRYDATHPQNSIGFYPLYPLIVRAVSAALHTRVFETGIAISLLGLLAALAILARLAAEWGEAEAAVPLAGCLLLFPGAFYLAAFYSESLFLLASAAAILATRRRSWVWAGFAGAAACLTRLNGFLIALPILVGMAGEVGGRRNSRKVAGLAFLAAGAAAFPVYLWRRWGDPLLYFRDKAAGWPSYRFGQFWRAFGRIPMRLLRSGPGSTEGIVAICEGLAVLLAAAGAIHLFRRRLFAEATWVAATILFVSLSGSFESFPRYALALFPAFLLPAVLARRSAAFALGYAIVGCTLGAALMVRFVQWIYVG